MPIQYSSTIKELPKGIREIAVDITAPEIETCFQKALRRLSRELEIEGFRKGKVPPHLAEKYIKPDAIFDEAAHIAIQDTYPDVVKHHELEPIGKPEVEVTKIARGDAMGYKVRVAVLGDVKLPDWKAKVQVKRNAIVAGEEEMAKAIAYLQKSRAQFTAVNRTAQKGDFVEIDFTMRRDGVILEGGVSQKHPFTLGEGKFIPGFEDGIVGMAVGEEKTYPLAFPDDYHEKTLAGKPVEATVKLVT
ncbi:MAG: trigger factor, partial [bacterium]|nr:trigger factor [bacterium]